MAEARRMRSRQAATAGRAVAARRSDPPDAARPCGRRGCSRRSTGSPNWSARTARRPAARSRPKSTAKPLLAGVIVHGRADRIDRLADGALAIIDYKTGQPPSQKAVNEGFALAAWAARPDRAGRRVRWRRQAIPKRSNIGRLTRYRGSFGRLMCPDKDMAAGRIPRARLPEFCGSRASDWLTGNEPFTAKLNPAYAPYGDYDQLMRLEEWYGRK